MRSSHSCYRCRRGGFTLVELLVVIAIIAILATVVMVGVPRWMDQSRKVTALTQMKEMRLGFAAFEAENGRRPLLSEERRKKGEDTVYGVKGGKLSNAIVVSVLSGEVVGRSPATEDLKVEDYCKKVEKYASFKPATKGRNGVGDDGVLYDPWGTEWMIAVNAFNAPGQDLVDFNKSNPGKNDKFLFTDGLAEYADSKPTDQEFVIWTYGKNGKMGSGEKVKGGARLQGSDDVVSW